MTAVRLEPLERFPDRSHAELARSRLEADGIPAWIEADDAGGQYPGLEARRGARLFVEAEDRPAARRLLDAIPAEAEEVELAPNEIGAEITEAAEAAVGHRAAAPRGLLAAFAVGVAVLAWWLTQP